ncbi:MAG: O-antigen ligase family protein [Acidimicrobiia bacterium]|nr:O-antigen ligase family protein [Acidimicrobiia bacterium]
MRVLTIGMAVLLGGYILIDRAFAWIHVPGTPIFLGEIALLAGIAIVLQTPHLGRLIRLSRPIQMLLLFMLWGFALAFEGYSNWGIDALRDSAIWYYGGFALIAGSLLLYNPDLWDALVKHVTRFLPLFFGVMVVRLVFSNVRIPIYIPDSTVRITAHKTPNIAVNVAIAIVFVLIVVWPLAPQEMRRRLNTLTLLGLVLLVAVGTQSRGGFLAGIVILAFVFFVARHARGAMLSVLTIAVLVAVMAAALDVRFQLARRELSVEQVIENVQSVTEEATSGSEFDNTTQWRLNFWSIVLEDVARQERFLTGFGFGENVAARYGLSGPNVERPLRNPHNSHLSVFARMGFVGAGLWLAMFGTWYISLMRARRQFAEIGEERRAALARWLMLAMTAILVNAFFDPALEGPQVGILMWSLFGMGAVLGLGARGGRRRPSSGDFDWLLLQDGPPVSPTHPSLALSPDLQEVVTGFDELLAEDPGEDGEEA